MRTPDASRLTLLAAELQDQPDEARTVQAILGRASDVVPEAEHVSLTVRRDRGLVTLAATSVVAEQADDLQYALAEGPCVAAASTEVEWFRSGDVADDARWPRWGPLAADLGVRSLLSVQLLARGERIGAMNMYSGEPGCFDDAQIRDNALLYAIHAAYALSGSRLVTGLEAAMGSRHTIGLAQGILMERYGLGVDAALAVLRRLSTTGNRKLRDLALELALTGRLDGLDLSSPRRGRGPGARDGSDELEER